MATVIVGQSPPVLLGVTPRAAAMAYRTVGKWPLRVRGRGVRIDVEVFSMGGHAYVVGVSSKAEPGIPKLPQEQVMLVAGHGVEGDYHAGEFVRHRSRAAKTPEQPNMRQVHIIHSELFDELAPLGITVKPGQMGENITTRGLPILDLASGTRLHLGDSAVVEITGLRNPCNQLDSVDERLLAQVANKTDGGEIVRRAGIMGIVIEGGGISAGDAIRVETPAGAGGRLQPV